MDFLFPLCFTLVTDGCLLLQFTFPSFSPLSQWAFSFFYVFTAQPGFVFPASNSDKSWRICNAGKVIRCLACQTALQNILSERHCKFKMFLSSGQCPPGDFWNLTKEMCQYKIVTCSVTCHSRPHVRRCHRCWDVTLFPSHLNICDTFSVTS